MRSQINVDILLTPGSEAGVVLGVRDAFWSVGRLWNQVHGLEQEPLFAPRLVGATDQPVSTATGVQINPDLSVMNDFRSEIVFVPSLLPCGNDRMADVAPGILDWIQSSAQHGSTIVSSCTGSFLLAETGLLDDRDATTHWAFVDLFRVEYPRVRVHPERTLVAADADQSVITAGGASSWTDLTLYLVGRYANREQARRLAQMSLFDCHHEGQNPYARLTTRTQIKDRVIQEAQEWLSQSYDQPDIVQQVIRRTGIAERTFNRRFRSATGMSPLEYLQALRIEEAKQMLETSSKTVQSIANAVGYEDVSSFRRLFKAVSGITPADHRKRFRGPNVFVPVS